MHTVHLAATGLTGLGLPDTYGYVLIVAALVAFEVVLIGFLIAGQARGKVFTQEFMEQHFGEEHKEATGLDIEKGGLPDMGSGLYSRKLAYKDWWEFNNAQRAHYNYLEFAPSTLAWIFISGLYFPIPSAAIGAALIIFRLMYAVGYAKSGPKGRGIGALGNDLCILGLFGLSLASGIMFAMGKSL
jgi:uncharacterized membrane protein YecN with MAPEG domain